LQLRAFIFDYEFSRLLSVGGASAGFAHFTHSGLQEDLEMKLKTLLLIFAAILPVGLANADTVIEEVPDTLPGTGFGGLTGFMVGATAGPFGALAGAGIGALGGALFQRETGFSGHAYRIQKEDGTHAVVRSPGRSWSNGDQVEVVSGRLVAKTMHAQR
jgi:outer membrane lipoprotein SlyB